MESAAIRRRTMQAVKSKDTAPELAVRHLAHRMGYRFRLHRKDLPGKPDLVFPRLHKVVFVHGCFWHGHECAQRAGAGAEPRLLDEEDCATKTGIKRLTRHWRRWGGKSRCSGNVRSGTKTTHSVSSALS